MSSLTDTDRACVITALTVSLWSVFGRVKIGAVVADKNGAIISSGCNSRLPHPRQYEANKRAGRQTESPCLHAEMAALLTMEKRVPIENRKPATMFIARLDRNGRLGNCKPCPACHSELMLSNITRVVYTTPEGVKEYDLSNAG